jgi:PatG C-terminal
MGSTRRWYLRRCSWGSPAGSNRPRTECCPSRRGLLGAIPRPDDIAEADDDRFRETAAELFDSILQMADNAGATDEQRALNYLAVRYPAIYARTAAAHAGNASLAAVDTARHG